VSAFDQLHPALQHHIVNSLGWRDLRPFQEDVIPPVLAGLHLIILAPTAGGKTEAAFFPVLSRMLSDGWAGLTVLYICPIKALLNNLDLRLQRYCSLVGRSSALWHGDIRTSARHRILRAPPDCLLTTPESLEVMLVSRKVDRRSLFKDLRVVIVDEIHAFAGDDRGWHLLAVLERVSKLAGRELQRLGLSATVGNPEDLAGWLAGSCRVERRVMLPPATESAKADVRLDFVGSLENAATVISRLHRGEKRLVFLDSRARAEELGARLRELQVDTFVTHSSLSPEQRHQAEEAFAVREDCVIVATSVLELGVDVGDLDRVIQIDAPTTVSSFLQRMGRTGRRSDTQRNCLYLATSEGALLQAAALIHLWECEFVEPVVPPPQPLHVLAQQLMALALQEGGIGRDLWQAWIGTVPAFAAMSNADTNLVIGHMVTTDIMWDDQGILWFGRKGEEEYGRRNFMDLLSMISGEPLFAVMHGRANVGYVHQLSFAAGDGGRTTLLLGGRSWKVNHLDWQRKVAFVEPTREQGRSRWMGVGQALSYEMSQAIRHILGTDEVSERWSRRARAQADRLRHDAPWVRGDSTAMVLGAERSVWWTFAGGRANAALAAALVEQGCRRVNHDNLSITIDQELRTEQVHSFTEAVLSRESQDVRVPVSDEAIRELKFSACLPQDLARRALELRLADAHAIRRTLAEPVRFVG
jgi:ATP-dependent Lhr-like helicase